MKYLLTTSLLGLCTACGVTNQAVLSPEIAAKIAEARSQLESGDPISALEITDKLLERDRSLREARLLAGEANAALFSKEQSEAYLKDAIKEYRQALALDEEDPETWNSLADLYRMAGEYEPGRDAALRAAASYQGRDPDAMARSLLRAAENEMEIFKASWARDQETEDKAESQQTRTAASLVLSRLEAVKQMLPGIGYHRASQVYRYLGRGFDEVESLERGIQAQPDYFPIHERYRELRVQRGEEAQCVAFYRALLRDDGMNAALAYAQGMAESSLGDRYRRNSDRDKAEVAYTAAIKTFGRCETARPDWKANCDHWIAVDRLSLAKMHEEAGNLAVAQGHLEKAFAASPKVTMTGDDGRPLITDSLGTSYYFGILQHIGRALASGGTKEALRDGFRFWETFIALHPEQQGWMYNNAAFTARDLGTAIENSGSTDAEKQAAAAEAKKLYERSYELYDIAVRLDPNDARTVNDKGLMLLYHLKRDYDVARGLFEQAIRVGREGLDRMPQETPQETRDLAEEAVGDAYQNLGKLLMEQGKPFAEYSVPLRESVKYYPGQRRESARWLRRGERGGADPAAAAAADPRAQALAPVLVAAGKLAEAKDFDGALLALDKVSDRMLGFAPYHYRVGTYSLEYARQAARAGGTAGQVDGLFADARNNLQKAVELDGEPIDPRLQLAAANYESGEYENAAKIAAALVLHMASRGDASDDQIAATQRLRALSGGRLYIAARQTRNDLPEELQAARNAFRNLERMGRLDTETRDMWWNLERWAGDQTAALGIFLRAVERTPRDSTLLGEFIKAAQAQQQSAAAAEVLSKREDATSLWYAGMALYYSSFEPPATDKPEAVRAALEQAIAKFEVSAAANPSFKASCDTWIAISHGTMGFNSLAREDIADAEARFLLAAQRDPARLEAPVSGQRSVKTGIELVVHHHYTNKDLAAAVKTLEKACAVIPNDAGLSNNLGLFARDHGVALQRSGNDAEAKRLFEVSFNAYRNAVRLEPRSVRQRNDLMVMILYHVKRELDTVVGVLESCIADGEKQLGDDPPEDPQALQDLQESVGDSYENLGYYYRHYGNDLEKARKNFEKSLEFWPKQRRRGVQWLQELSGGKRRP